jgi:DNA-binding NarL/FixJ family response regulator
VAALEPRIAIVGGSGAVATEGLAWMLTKSGIRVVGVYRSFRELPSVSRASELNLQAVIVDADDPLAGPTVVTEIRRTRSQLKIVLLCEVASPAVVGCAIEEGAEGVVLKSDTTEEVVLALRLVLGGRAVLPVGWHQASLEPEPAARLAGLSERELEVLELAACGMSNKEIAERLVISYNTVKFHLRTIYATLGVHNRVQATQAIAQTNKELAERFRLAEPHPAG